MSICFPKWVEYVKKEERIVKHGFEYHILLLVVKLVTTGSILSVLELLIQMNASSEKMFRIIARPALNRKNNKRFLVEKQSQALPAKKVPKRGKLHLPKNMKLKHRYLHFIWVFWLCDMWKNKNLLFALSINRKT